MKDISGSSPVVWGNSIVGFGSYYYRHKNGYKVDAMNVGFASRKRYISIYGAIFHENNADLLDQLGQYKKGKSSSLFIKRLKDVKIDVLSELIKRAYLLSNHKT